MSGGKGTAAAPLQRAVALWECGPAGPGLLLLLENLKIDIFMQNLIIFRCWQLRQNFKNSHAGQTHGPGLACQRLAGDPEEKL